MSAQPQAQAAAQDVVSYGRTLTRRMRAIDVMAHLAGMDAGRAIGIVHVAACRSHIAGVLNVEAWTEDLDPVLAIAALKVAEQRLRIIHQIGPEKLQFQAIDLYDAEVMRTRAEEFVDMCRSSRIGRAGDKTLHSFDLTRENCIRAAVVMLASASVTPTSLSQG